MYSFVEGLLVVVNALNVDDFVSGFYTKTRNKWFVDILLVHFKAKVIVLPSDVLGLSVKWEPIVGQSYFQSIYIENIKTVNALETSFDLVGAKPSSLSYNLAAMLSKLHCPSEYQLECSDVKNSSQSIERWLEHLYGPDNYSCRHIPICADFIAICS